MKIEGPSLPQVGNIQRTNRPHAVERDSVKLGSDEVAVSGKGQLYQSLIQKTAELPAVREDVVTDLTQKLTSGEFIIDGQRVATKMLDDEI